MGVSIVIADDHPVVLMGLESLFSVESDFDVVGKCVDGMEAVEAVIEHRPDILVLDLNLPRLDGLGVLRSLAGRGLKVGTIMLTASLSPAEAHAALELGARGILLKAQAPRQLIQCVRTVHMGGWWLEEHGIAGARWNAPSSIAANDRSPLTERERTIAELVAKGHRNKEIAQALSITEGTVKVHLGNIYRKVDVNSRVGLALHMRNGGR